MAILVELHGSHRVLLFADGVLLQKAQKTFRAFDLRRVLILHHRRWNQGGQGGHGPPDLPSNKISVQLQFIHLHMIFT